MPAANSVTSRLSALGLLFALVGCIVLLVALPLIGQFDDYERKIATRESLLAQNHLLAARGLALKGKRDRLQDDLSKRAGFLQGSSSELISAALQDRLKRLTTRAGATLNSTQALTAEAESGFGKVRLRVNMTAEIDAIQGILHDLESSRPLLFVDNLELRTVSLRSGRGGQAIAPLQVRFDLYGFTSSVGEGT